jgi:hypothetical protein
MSSKKDDDVGYGKPPVHGRFVRGRSGNPKGRPRGSKNFQTDLLAELEEPISIRVGERVRSISKQRALIKTMMSRALKSDVRAADVPVKWRGIDHEEPASEVDEGLSADNQELLAGIEARLFPRNPPVSDKSDEDTDESGND